MSSKSRYRGRRAKGRQAVAVASARAQAPRSGRPAPPDLEAVRAALRRCQGRASVKVLPDLNGRPNPIVSFVDDAAKAEFERVLAEEFARRRVVIPEGGRVIIPHEVACGT